MTTPEYVKIRLKGESPWGEVIARDNGTITVKIANMVAGDYSPEDWSRMLDAVFHEKDAPDPNWEWDGIDHRPHNMKFGDTIIVHETEYGLEPVPWN